MPKMVPFQASWLEFYRVMHVTVPCLTIATVVPQIFNYVLIRKYGSTFYIGIAMVVLPYFGLWEN